MIKKVAEAQALRGAFQGVFKGTYDESEQWKQETDNQLELKRVEGKDWELLKEAVKQGRYSSGKAIKQNDLTAEQKSELYDIEEGKDAS